MSRRENTFRIDYGNVPKKPSFEEVHQFVGTILGLKRDDVARIQCSRSVGCAFVKVNNLTTAKRVVDEHDNKHDITVDGKSYKIRILMEDGSVEVKLHDLSEDVTDQKIAEFLNKYGDVISVTELMWGEKFLFGGIPTGIRVAKMLVQTNIPSFVSIDGESTCVTYYGQKQTCRHCNEFVHNGITCVQNKKLLVQKTYANVTKHNNSTRSITSKPAGPITHSSKPDVSKPTGPKPDDSKLPTPRLTLQNRTQASSSLITNTSTRTDLFKLPEQRLAAQITRNEGGSETDDSTTSTNSRRPRGRPPGKKMRPDENADIAATEQ